MEISFCPFVLYFWAMILKEFAYKKDRAARQNDLELEKLSFSKLNLIVGKNASGKSRVLNSIIEFAYIVTHYYGAVHGQWAVSFLDKDIEIKYQLEIENGKIVNEAIFENGKQLLQRSLKTTKIYSAKKQEHIKINPPNDRVIFSSRDTQEYPYLEKIVEWAENTYLFKFGEFNSRSSLSNEIGIKSPYTHNLNYFISKVNLTSDKDDVIKLFNKLGYEISDFSLNTSNNNSLEVREKSLRLEIEQADLSQGMFRSLVFLIFLKYLLKNEKQGTVMIDDLGEGLDYERVVKLGKIIIKLFKDSNFQLIATSNDSFLMDVVPIEYWNILIREGSKVKCLNYQNSKDIFDEFRFTGLIPFDLFSSDYLLSKTA
ncbi:MAG TPA: ATP-binding protein [Bacteroidetes bacterium]|nr:ATP-binding protein [Bacteroidota bacterium]